MTPLSRRQALAVVVGTAMPAKFVAGAVPDAASEVHDPLKRAALQSVRALDAVLLGIARAGERLVAVGERGVVLLSDDYGKAWRQAAVPVSTTLTAVSFPSAQVGFAVGHAGVVLRSRDGGQTWERRLDGVAAAQLVLEAARAPAADRSDTDKQLANAERLVADGADKPLLDVNFIDVSNGWVAGAYGVLLRTNDGGDSWASAVDRIENPKGLHLNSIAVRESTVLIAGEQGQIWHSADSGGHFARLSSPYEGSWFSGTVLPSGRLVIAGLRGNAWYSDDQGATFTRSSVPMPVTLSELASAAGGVLLALNQSGQILGSLDQGTSFQLVALPPGAPLTSLLPIDGKTLVGASLRGPRRTSFSMNPKVGVSSAAEASRLLASR